MLFVYLFECSCFRFKCPLAFETFEENERGREESTMLVDLILELRSTNIELGELGVVTLVVKLALFICCWIGGGVKVVLLAEFKEEVELQ